MLNLHFYRQPSVWFNSPFYFYKKILSILSTHFLNGGGRYKGRYYNFYQFISQLKTPSGEKRHSCSNTMLAEDSYLRKCNYLTKSAWYFRTQVKFRYQAKLSRKVQTIIIIKNTWPVRQHTSWGYLTVWVKVPLEVCINWPAFWAK